MNHCLPRRFVLAASILALVAPSVSADILDQYTFGTSAPAILTPTTVGTGVVASAITGDAGVNLDVASNATTPPPTAPWLRIDPKAPNTTATAAIGAAADFKFTLSALPGFTLNLSSLSFDVARGGSSSTRGYAVQSSVDNFGSTISSADVTAVRPTFVNVPISLSATNYQNLSSITFKIFSYSGNTGHSVEYDNITVNGTSTFSGYTWQGGSSTWDTVAANWTGPQTTYVDSTAGSNVLFSDAGATGNVNVTQTGLNPNLITFTNTSAKEYTFNGGNLNVATSLFKSGDGNTTFNNTVSAGSVTADRGTLIVGPTGKLSSSNITVSPTGSLSVATGGVLGATGTLTVNGTLNLNNAAQSVNSLNGASTGSIFLSGTALELSGTSTYAGIINGDGSLKVTGGTVTLSGANGYSGNTTVAGGALQLSNVTAAGYGKITVNNGGVLSLGAGISNGITLAAGSTIGVSAGVTAFADVTVSGASTIKTFNPITGATPNDLIVTGMLQGSGDLNIVSINGNLPDGAAFRLRGLNSTGDNAYRGTITVGQSGKFELQFADTVGSPMGTGKLVVTGGTTSTTNAGTFSIVNLRNNSIGSATLGNNVEVTGVGSAYFNMLGNAPTGSSVNLGDLRIGDGQTVAAVSSTTGTGPYTLSFASVHLTGGNATFVPRPVGNTNYAGENNISLGPITENVAGSGIIMNGAATLTLTGNSNYTGATVVNSGTLVVDGKISGSAVAVNGGILRGIGTTGPLTIRSGTLAPGNGFGSLTTGNLIFDTGSTLAIEIGGNTMGSYDQVNVVGSLSFNAPVTLTLDFSTYDPVNGDSFTLFSNDMNDAVAFGSEFARFVFGSTQLDEGTVFTATSGAFTQDFRITYAGGTNGNDIVLTAVPEPGTATGLLLGLGMLAGSRRRRS